MSVTPPSGSRSPSLTILSPPPPLRNIAPADKPPFSPRRFMHELYDYVSRTNLQQRSPSTRGDFFHKAPQISRDPYAISLVVKEVIKIVQGEDVSPEKIRDTVTKLAYITKAVDDSLRLAPQPSTTAADDPSKEVKELTAQAHVALAALWASGQHPDIPTDTPDMIAATKKRQVIAHYTAAIGLGDPRGEASYALGKIVLRNAVALMDAGDTKQVPSELTAAQAYFEHTVSKDKDHQGASIFLNFLKEGDDFACVLDYPGIGQQHVLDQVEIAGKNYRLYAKICAIFGDHINEEDLLRKSLEHDGPEQGSRTTRRLGILLFSVERFVEAKNYLLQSLKSSFFRIYSCLASIQRTFDRGEEDGLDTGVTAARWAREALKSGETDRSIIALARSDLAPISKDISSTPCIKDMSVERELRALGLATHLKILNKAGIKKYTDEIKLIVEELHELTQTPPPGYTGAAPPASPLPRSREALLLLYCIYREGFYGITKQDTASTFMQDLSKTFVQSTIDTNYLPIAAVANTNGKSYLDIIQGSKVLPKPQCTLATYHSYRSVFSAGAVHVTKQYSRHTPAVDLKQRTSNVDGGSYMDNIVHHEVSDLQEIATSKNAANLVRPTRPKLEDCAVSVKTGSELHALRTYQKLRNLKRANADPAQQQELLDALKAMDSSRQAMLCLAHHYGSIDNGEQQRTEALLRLRTYESGSDADREKEIFDLLESRGYQPFSLGLPLDTPLDMDALAPKT